MSREGVGPVLLPILASLLLLVGCATGTASGVMPEGVGGSGNAPGDVPACAAQPLAPGWPDFSGNTQELLAPFLACASPGEFLALQQCVDMPQVVARLDPWSAVRLGSLGPVREDAARLLNRQRTAFLMQALERYGPAPTEVLALFVLDACHDDDLRDILFLLAQDKRLTELLEQLPSLGPALEARGLKPSKRADRDFQWSDVGRGLSRAAQDALSTSPMVNGAQSTLMELATLEAQLPPPYQQALYAADREQLARRFSAGNLTVGFLDHMTFGVPLGFYGLVAGTGQGVQSLTQGKYEQSVRELAPAAVLVALYAGGRSAAWLSETRAGPWTPGGLEVLTSRVKNLGDMARQVRGLLGEEGMRELADSIRASREAGRWVAVGGMDAALALHEARGDVAQAQAMLSKARPGATGTSTGKGSTRGASGAEAGVANEAARPSLRQGGIGEQPTTLAAWVDEGAGLTREVVQAKLAAAEAEATSPRLSKDVAVLERQRPSHDAPPPEAKDNPRWSEYVAYYERRLVELKEGKAAKGPLRWAAYERLWGWFTRGLEFERAMMKLLEADARLPRAVRRFLGGFDRPRVERHVGVKKPATGVCYADVIVIEEGQSAGGPPRVETFSFKSRDFSGLDVDALSAQMAEDAREALRKYGEDLEIRRDSLQSLLHGSGKIPVQRVYLVYEGGELKPMNPDNLGKALLKTAGSVPEVEVQFQ